MKKYDGNELDYNIVFNDEIADDNIDVDDVENEEEVEQDKQSSIDEDQHSNKNKSNAESFYSNYFNPNTTTRECDDDNCNDCHQNNIYENTDQHAHCYTHNSDHICPDCDHDHIANEEEYNRAREENLKKKLSKYKDFEFDDETDYTCELDPNKICDNCGMCLDSINTDKDGYAEIKIDKIDKSGSSLDELYKMYGLDDD